MPDPLRGGRVIRDPIHGYIEVPDELDPLVRSGAVQRLRHISQNSRAVAGFPSMTGTRYEHALGTMHLAVRAWRSSWQHTIAPAGVESSDTQSDFKRAVIRDARALPDRDPITDAWVGSDCAAEETPLWDDFEHRIGLVLGAIGLLHDVGHPPFSHVLEPFYARHLASIFGATARAAFDGYASAAEGSVQFHEWAGLRIFDDIPDGPFGALPRALIRRVLADRSGSGWAYCLHSLIDSQFDVDRLDYLLRDAANAGTEYGGIDTTRLLQSLELHRPGVDDWRIGLGARAVSSFETLLIQRAQHYRWVVHHPATVAADAALRRCTEAVHELSRLAPADPAGDPAGDPDGTGPMSLLRARLPDLDYISAIARHEDGCQGSGSIHTCVDDHECLSWLRAVRPALSTLARSAKDADVRRRARTALSLQGVFDTFAVTPIAAWRNYQEFLARADQNPAQISRLVGAAEDAEPPGYLRTAAARGVVAALMTELPARLNSALDRLLRPIEGDTDIRGVEDLLERQAGRVDGCGEGTWIVTYVPFLALQDDVAQIWRGDHPALLSDVSPYPLALAAIEIMRPRYYVFFVPFDGAGGEASTAQRRAVGRAFFAAISGLG